MSCKQVFITGGAGFNGSNLANQLLGQGHQVTVIDNLSRPGCESNLAWLRKAHGANALRLVEENLTNFEALREAAEKADRVYHSTI